MSKYPISMQNLLDISVHKCNKIYCGIFEISFSMEIYICEKCHIFYTSMFSDKHIYHRKICKIAYKHKCHVHFSKYLLSPYYYATIYNSNLLTFLPFYLHFPQFINNIYIKTPIYRKFYPKFVIFFKAENVLS